MAYISNAPQDVKEMLNTLGIESVEELLTNIPQNLRFKGQLNLPQPLSELEADQLLKEIAGRNVTGVSFLGGGVYDHYIPAVVDEVSTRPEFYTSYTPYQPEVSQGNLQVMYEFQSMISELTAMDVTNASMYEGGSALAEAILMALGHTRKSKVLIPATLNPAYQAVVQTYLANMDVQLKTIPMNDLVIDWQALRAQWDEQTAAVVIQHPNYYGYLEAVENLAALKEKHSHTLLIMVYDPISLGLLEPPGALGADIAVAEGQSLGIPQNYGGPFVGLFSTTQKLIRKIPGRLSGVTVDVDGKRGFVLTLQTREQHIRREKATSNICTNSGLMAVRVAIYLSLMGKEGIQEVARITTQKAHYLAEQLTTVPGVRLGSSAPFFKEFTVHLPVQADKVVKAALDEGVFAGIPVAEDQLLIAVTEKRTREQLDHLTALIKKTVV